MNGMTGAESLTHRVNSVMLHRSLLRSHIGFPRTTFMKEARVLTLILDSVHQRAVPSVAPLGPQLVASRAR